MSIPPQPGSEMHDNLLNAAVRRGENFVRSAYFYNRVREMLVDLEYIQGQLLYLSTPTYHDEPLCKGDECEEIGLAITHLRDLLPRETKGPK